MATSTSASMDREATARWGGYACIAGSLIMVAGAVCKIVSGVDLDASIAAGDLGGYLSGAVQVESILVANLSLWIVGVLGLGAAGAMLAAMGRSRPVTARWGRLCYTTAVPLAMGAFVAWLAIVVQLSGSASATDVAIAEVVAWFASRADWTATVLVVGLGPLLVSLAGRGDWVPRWLLIWSFAAAGTGGLTVLAMFIGGLTGYGFLIVPVGLGWTIAAGIVLLRHGAHA